MVKLPNNIWLNTCLAAGIGACIFLLFPVGIFNVFILPGFTDFISFFLGSGLIFAAAVAVVCVALLIVLRWRRR